MELSLKELKETKLWLNWNKEQKEDGNITKVPYAFDGTKIGADPKFSQKWCDYETAKVQVNDFTANGVGIVLTKLIPNASEEEFALVAIDIDHRDLDDIIVQDILSTMNTYTEKSPSGKGFHLLCLVKLDKLPENLKETYYMKNPHNGVEAYVGGHTNRFMTFTENVVVDKPICERTTEFLHFLDTHMKRNIDFSSVSEEVESNVPIENNPVPLNDVVLANAIMRISGNDKFDRLFNYGDKSAYNDDDSSADMALACILAYYIGPNSDRIFNLIKKSALYRIKWERQDYRENTIQKAISFCNGNFFDWRNEDISENEIENGTLNSFTAEELMSLQLEPLVPIVEKMLYPGFSILAGAPKVGKSWACLDLCLSICKGEPFIGFNTNKHETLYLALEDSINRIQDRLGKILGTGQKVPAGFHIVTECNPLDQGLLSQLQGELNKFPNIKLIIIDTLQKVRGAQVRGETWYASDYKEMAKLKRFADINKVCILAIHHLRKQKDTDPFNQISGSTGITGAADSMIVLSKMDGGTGEVMMSITGRDVDSTELVLKHNKSTYKWEIASETSNYENYKEQLEYQKNPVVITIKALVKEHPKGIRITASKLLHATHELTGFLPRQKSPQALSREINDHLQFLLWDLDKIYYEPGNSNGGKGGRELYFAIKKDEKIIQEDNADKTQLDDDITTNNEENTGAGI